MSKMTSSIDPKVAAAVLDATGAFVSTRVDGTAVHYISAADTARMIRSALALAFPGVKFSVRSSCYSGGSSVNVRWTDGPAKSRVDAALSGFAAKGFDGMIDMEFSSDCYVTRAGSVGFARTAGTEGSRGTVPAAKADVPYGAAIVRFGSYIFTERALTVPFPPFDDWAAWHRLNETDLPPAAPRKF